MTEEWVQRDAPRTVSKAESDDAFTEVLGVYRQEKEERRKGRQEAEAARQEAEVARQEELARTGRVFGECSPKTRPATPPPPQVWVSLSSHTRFRRAGVHIRRTAPLTSLTSRTAVRAPKLQPFVVRGGASAC